MRFPFLAVAALVVAAPALADDDRRVPALLDGQEVGATGWSLEGEDAPCAPGDVLGIEYGGWVLVRDRAEVPSYAEEGPVLLEVSADGGRRVVAARLPDALGGRRTAARLSDADLPGLRGIRVDRVTPEVARALARIDPDRACVSVACPLEEALPHLPPRLRHLRVTGRTPSDLSGLSRLGSLRFLVLWGEAEGGVDAAALAALRDLRVLALACGRVEGLPSLATATSLRELDLSWCEALADLQWLGGHAGLRRLDVSHTGVSDLSPLAGLPALEVVDAHAAPVRVLPASAGPALRRLRLPSTSGEGVAAFRRANPGCEVPATRKDALLGSVSGVERVRVRTGGTCHRDPETEVVRADLTTPEAIRDLVDLLEVDDCGGHEGCMCCGECTFEFHAGSTLLAEVSLHHANHLRWRGGGWNGDVPLISRSARALAEWLARRGEPGPAGMLDWVRRSAVVEERRDARRIAILGAARAARLFQGLDETHDLPEQAALLREAEPDPDARVFLALRLLGASPADDDDDLDRALRFLLDERPVAEVRRAGAAAASGDPEALRGFDLWVLHASQPGPGTLRGRDALLSRALERLLADPDPHERRGVLRCLGRLEGRVVVGFLRAVLAGRRFGAGTSDAPESAENVLVAAEALLRLRDRESLPAIRAAIEALESRNRRHLLERVEALEADR